MHYKNLQEYFEGESARIDMLKSSGIELELEISGLYISEGSEKERDYSVTHSVDTLSLNEFGIIGDRHNSGDFFTMRKREGHIYPKGTLIRNDRHILGISDGMIDEISEKMGIDVSPELLGVNIVFSRRDGETFCFDGLPLGTDFMVYDSSATSPQQKEYFIANFKLATFQSGCGITGMSIANKYRDKSQNLNFIKNSKKFRGILLYLHGPQEVVIQKGFKVFIGLPTGYVN